MASPNGCQDERVSIVQEEAVRQGSKWSEVVSWEFDVPRDRLDVAFRSGAARLRVGNHPRGMSRLTRILERSLPELILMPPTSSAATLGVAKATILLTDEIPAPPALVRLGIDTLPASIGIQDERTRLRFIQFFTANISVTAHPPGLCAGG